MSSLGAAGEGGSVSRSSPPRRVASDLRFPRARRLTARNQYRAVYDRGRRVRSPLFTLFGLPNQAGTCRLGITATRKVGGAVVRNRMKRLVREAFRRHAARLTPPLDLVVHVRAGLERRSADEVEREFVRRFAELRGPRGKQRVGPHGKRT